MIHQNMDLIVFVVFMIQNQKYDLPEIFLLHPIKNIHILKFNLIFKQWWVKKKQIIYLKFTFQQKKHSYLSNGLVALASDKTYAT